ncbi:MAG: FHA domain-containing protein [Anaerolineae bacterium]|nr:FHA domain-containing protein [Anaerolineae bacterium]
MTDGFRLVMTQGPQSGQTFTLDSEIITIGRDPSNDLAIGHLQVSRQHARLTLQGGVIVLEDLGSTNGTFVNGMRLTSPHTLANGDVVGLGESVTLTFYGRPTGMEETVVTRPGEIPSLKPQASSPPPPPTYSAPPVAESVAHPPRRSRRGLWIGVGCLVVVLVLCIAVAAFLWVAPERFWLWLFDLFGMSPFSLPLP